MTKQFNVLHTTPEGVTQTGTVFRNTIDDALICMESSFPLAEIVSIEEKLPMNAYKVIMVQVLNNGTEVPMKARVFALSFRDASVKAKEFYPNLRVFSITKGM